MIFVDDNADITPATFAYALARTDEANTMTPEAFKAWLAEMKSAGLARSDAKCAEALGLSANSILAMKKNGTDRRTALACRALLHRLEPYGS